MQRLLAKAQREMKSKTTMAGSTKIKRPSEHPVSLVGQSIL